MVKKVNVHGKIMTIAEAARKYNLRDTTIYTRYARGVRGDDLVKPSHPYNEKFYTGVKDDNGKEIMTMGNLSRYSGIHPATLFKRYEKGWRGEKLVSNPHKSNYPTGVYDPDTQEEITSLPEIANRFNMADGTIYRRYFDFGLRGQDLVSPLSHHRDQHTEVYDTNINELGIANIANISKASVNTLWTRYSRGNRGDRLLMNKYKEKRYEING